MLIDGTAIIECVRAKVQYSASKSRAAHYIVIAFPDTKGTGNLQMSYVHWLMENAGD